MEPQVTYCGSVISGSGVKPVAARVEAIQEAPVPQDVSQLRAFLGMVNYYHRFLPNLATTLEPLHMLLRSGTKWEWKEEQHTAFETAKQLLQSAELLTHFNPNYPLILESDASDYGVGAVLSHQMPDGAVRPIGYASRTLNTAERGYSTMEKEALAIVYGVKKFHQYLYGHTFTIHTDHKPLEGLLNEQKGVPHQAAARIQRWALTLAAYEYAISYKPGKDNANADGLSRLPRPVSPESVPVPGETIMLMEHLAETPIQASHIKQWTRRDPVLSKVYEYTLKGWPASCESDEVRPYFNRKTELSTEDGCLLWGNRVVIPPQGRRQVMVELHEAHPGISRMKALARSYVWWPNIDSDLAREVKNCHQCAVHQKAPAEAPLHPWEWPGHPWTRLHIDYAGPYMGHHFLIVVDAHSNWLEVHLMRSTTSASTIEKLREIFATHGLPETIVSDNGSNFTSSEFEQFLGKNAIKHIRVAPYHPASNGQAERAVRVFKDGMAKMEGGSIQTKLSRFLLRYRITPHSTTGTAPAELLMKRKLRTQLDFLHPSTAELVRHKQTVQKNVHDYHAKERELKANDQVYVRDFSKPKTWTTGTIDKETGPVSAQVQLDDGRTVQRHHDHMRLRTEVPIHSTEGQASTSPVLESSPRVQLAPDQDTLSEPAALEPSTPIQPTPVSTRPVRTRRRPIHLEDYEL